MNIFLLIIFISISVLIFILFGGFIGLVIYSLVHTDIKSNHLDRIILDKDFDYEIDSKELDSVTNKFIKRIGGPLWGEKKVAKHLKKITINISKGYLDTKARNEKNVFYVGFTVNPKLIKLGISPNMVKKNKVILNKTALTYELFNACIWKFEKDGYMVSLAESFLDETDTFYYKYFKDINKDGVIDEKDIRIFKEKRAILDEYYKQKK